MSKNVTYSEVNLLYEVGYETVIFCVCGAFLWLMLVVFLYRVEIQFKKRRRGLARFHEQPFDEDEESSTTTRYMISFFTSGVHNNFKGPPTGRVVVHLLGSIFPGKIHELRASEPEQDMKLFSPLGSEKFLVTEDVRLGRLIGIVLRTEVEGPQPFWNCTTTIVRDVKTNEAWFFRVNHEIGFPPRLFQPATQEELCAFKTSLYRRIRREIRNGQFGFFSFLFRSQLSVYTYPQRWVTSLGLYCLFFVTCFLFLDFVFSPGHSFRDQQSFGTVHTYLNPTPIRPKPGKPGVYVLYGESAASYWIIHAVIPALISSCITSFIGFLMISFFREASKFETHFDEMDYVIGTALFEQSRKKAAMELKAKAILRDFDEASQKTSRTAQIEASEAGSDDGSLEASSVYYPVGHDPPEVPDEDKSIYRLAGFLRGMTKKTLVFMKLRKKSVESGHTISPPIQESSPLKPDEFQPNSSKRSSIVEGDVPQVVFLEPELSPYQQRQIMRRLFLGIDERGSFRRPSGSLGNLRLNSQNFMTFNVVEPPKESKGPKYDLGYLKGVRKWYQPITAWLLVITVIIMSVTFAVFVAVKGNFHFQRARGDKFVETLLSTLLIGLLVGTFICEPLKIFLIALWNAIKDKKIYKRIEKMTQKRNAT